MKRQLILAFLLVALLPLAVLATLNDHAMRAALTRHAEQALYAAASETAS